MTPRMRLELGVLTLLLAFLMWLAAAAQEPWIFANLLAAAVTTGWSAMRIPRPGERWTSYALQGFPAGMFSAAIGGFAVVRFAGWGAAEGWEGLTAIIVGFLSGGTGAVVGLAAGWLIGLRTKGAPVRRVPRGP